jgi:hypothetical protein
MMSRPCRPDLTRIHSDHHIRNSQLGSALPADFSVGVSDGSPTDHPTDSTPTDLRRHSPLAFTFLFSHSDLCYSRLYPTTQLGRPVFHSRLLRTSSCGVTTAHTADNNRTPVGYPVATPDTARMVSWFLVSSSCYGLLDFRAFTCTGIHVFKRDVLSTAQHPGNPLQYPPSSRTLSTRLSCPVAPRSDSKIGLRSRARAQRTS